jgi:hypothetical protein
MTRQSLVKILVGGAIAGTIALAAGPALADSLGSGSTTPTSPSPATVGTGSLQAIQAKAKVAIDRRVDALNRAISVLQADPNLGSDQAVLVGTAQKDVAGLQQLEQTIQQDTTAQQAKTDAGTIFTGYRVFALVLPVDRMVRFSDRATNVAVPRLDRIAARAAQSGNPAIVSLGADIQHQTQVASQALAGLPARVEAYTPAEYNANHGLLAGDRSDVQTARQALEKARDDVKQIRQLVRSGRQAAQPTS